MQDTENIVDNQAIPAATAHKRDIGTVTSAAVKRDRHEESDDDLLDDADFNSAPNSPLTAVRHSPSANSLRPIRYNSLEYLGEVS